MCGRTCLTLDPNGIVCACQYKRKTTFTSTGVDTKNEDEADLVLPEWRSEFNCGRTYIPSYNIAPTDITPVLISSAHFSDGLAENVKQSRVIVPMLWGMIPFWHKGDYRKHGLTTNNCRLEHLLDSKLYRGPFRRGQRCVVLCEGFYEWQTTKLAKPSERASYYLYMPQADNVTIYDKATWTSKNVNLLKMAGLFDVWEDMNGDKMFSYSIITFESSKILSWLHHRMPAILETDEQVNNWLDFERVGEAEALKLLKPASQLKWHPVSKLVNNSRNKSDQCNRPIDLVKTEKGAKSQKGTLLSWLRKRREDAAKDMLESDDDGENDTNDKLRGEPPRKRARTNANENAKSKMND